MVIFNIYGGYTMKTIRFISILLLLSLSANIQLFGNGDRKREQIAREKKEKALRIKKAQEKVRAEKSARAHKKAQNLPEIIALEQAVQNNHNDNILDQNLPDQEQDQAEYLYNFNNIIQQPGQNQDQNQNPVDNADEIADNDCVICMNSLDVPEEITTLSCNGSSVQNRHRFHTQCITQWFLMKETPECPTCKTVNPKILTDENVSQSIKNRFDLFIAERQLHKKRKALKIIAASAVTGIGAMILYPIIYKNVCENGNLEYCTKEQLCTIWHNISACTELCMNGASEHCTKEQLCVRWKDMKACTELCKDGILEHCTKEQLCNIHNFWKQCACSLKDLRGCLPAICQNLPYCPEVVTWLAETFSTTPEAIIKMFV